jgi:hypothetical protein
VAVVGMCSLQGLFGVAFCSQLFVVDQGREEEKEMKGGMQFRGSTHDQDMKYVDKQKKLKQTLSFPTSFEKKIARSSVQLERLRPWINRRVSELLEMTDEVVMEYR